MAKTHNAVLEDVRRRLGQNGKPLSHQAIQQRRQRIQKLVPMPIDIANYIIAQRAGTPLHRHLDAEKLGQVAEFEARLVAKENERVPTATQRARRKPGIAPVTKELRLDNIKVPASSLTQMRMDEAKRMASVYPILYAFENSIREFIDGHLTDAYGDGWPDDPKIVNTTIKARVARNRNAEARHRYHSRRTARFIYYTDLGDLPLLAHSENGWKVFKSLLPSDKWLPAVVEKIEASRNVVAHMNPLEKRDIDRIKINFEDWLDQIRDHAPLDVPG